ncbi:hypothetical protein CQA38_05745 [Campylobacter sp. MIT 12-5580]|uniref:restriction endonuclease subunit S n=1 Tax=Campylobacter sp. MIT 12-5580 TaxID=2040651 RepID=UPI0010F509D3|nr:restriction endonuclease subunit S [Campylobacter sp. MIT 12-5580]TKX29063.1 hypothetical protein CQA38_05745 [Campylobacter sp. MIT 12-5580]
MLFITPTDYKNYHKFATNSERKISNEGIKRFSKIILPKNSILVTCIGSDMGKVVMNNTEAITNQQINSIIPNPLKANNDFLYYSMVGIYPTLRLFGGDGTAVPILNKGDFENLTIALPPLKTQEKIAQILSSFDDKIVLLHKQNKTLESIAQTLFRHHFIENAKEDWEEKVITDLFEVKDGTHDSPKQKEFGKKLITSKHILKNKLDFDNAYFISKEDFEKINKRSKVEQGDILFSMIGTIGLTYLEQSNTINYAIKNIGLFKTSQNKKFMYFVYLWLNSTFGIKFIHENRGGSTQEYVTLNNLRSIVFNIPDDENFNLFNQQVKPMFDKIYHNSQQIQNLESLRDIILKKIFE